MLLVGWMYGDWVQLQPKHFLSSMGLPVPLFHWMHAVMVKNDSLKVKTLYQSDIQISDVQFVFFHQCNDFSTHILNNDGNNKNNVVHLCFVGCEHAVV